MMLCAFAFVFATVVMADNQPIQGHVWGLREQAVGLRISL